MRTQKQIEKQIEDLRETRKIVPEFAQDGSEDNNWDAIDSQIVILSWAAKRIDLILFRELNLEAVGSAVEWLNDDNMDDLHHNY